MRRVTRTIKRKRVNLETLRRAKFLITHNGYKGNKHKHFVKSWVKQYSDRFAREYGK